MAGKTDNFKGKGDHDHNGAVGGSLPKAPTQGRLVAAYLAEGGQAAAMVAKVNEDGTLNLRVFAPDGGADPFFSGVLRKEDVDKMEDGADKNAAMACTWAWPERRE